MTGVPARRSLWNRETTGRSTLGLNQISAHSSKAAFIIDKVTDNLDRPNLRADDRRQEGLTFSPWQHEQSDQTTTSMQRMNARGRFVGVGPKRLALALSDCVAYVRWSLELLIRQILDRSP